MITAILWLAALILIVAGLAALGRRRPMTDREYEERRGKGAGLGNALLALHDLLEPQRGQAGKTRLERRAEEDPGGDPPEPKGDRRSQAEASPSRSPGRTGPPRGKAPGPKEGGRS